MGHETAERIDREQALSMAGAVDGPASILYDDGPWGRIYRLPYEHGACYLMVVTEHTESDHLAEMLSALPDRICYSHQEVMNGTIDRQARHCTAYYLWSYSGRVPLARTSQTTIILAAEILLSVR